MDTVNGCLTSRSVLWYLIFWGCVVNYMVTTNINIAIVAMVVGRPPQSNVTAATSECIAVNFTVSADVDVQDNFTVADINGTSLNNEVRYSWDEYQQGLILGGFFWLHWVSQIPGGVLAQNYGTKLVYGVSNVVMCILGFFIPLASASDYRFVVLIRVLQGFVGGLVWPAMHNIIAKWIPPNERSTFVTAYTGGSIGVALTFCLGGIIIDWLGWEAVFHLTGAFGVVWFICWWYLIYDTPDQHPRIDPAERDYIAASLGQSVSRRRPRTPWKDILFSLVMWITILVHWSSNMGIFTLMTQSPTYFKYIHGWNISMTGLLSGLPHICRTLFGYFFSVIGDWLIRSDKMSRTGVRKLATFTCCVVMGAFTLGVGFSDCNYLAAIVCVTMATAVSGAIATGPLATFVDLSPNFAGILMGISCTLSFTAAFISPLIVSVLTFNNQTSYQWKLVYIIVSALLIVPGAIYMCFATSDLQPWNSPGPKGQELKQIHAVNNDKDVEEKFLNNENNHDR